MPTSLGNADQETSRVYENAQGLQERQDRPDSNKVDKPFWKNEGELDMFFIENNHEAIVNRETFEAVQRRKKIKRTNAPQQFHVSLLSNTFHYDTI